MTASAPITTAASCEIRPATSLIDASTRGPVLWMAGGAVKWLLVSLVAGLLSTMKLHMPNLLAGIPALTYGRLVALQDSVFIYGFASQAAMAVALWLICRLGGTTLVGRGPIFIAQLIWNLGVVVGALGILAGDLLPFEHFQFPHGAMKILFAAYCVYGICALLTFASRKECKMYPSLWFVFTAIVFFPWVLATAAMTLSNRSLPGSVTPLVAAWAGNNIVMIWLGCIGLASIFYLLPKITGKTLYSQSLAVFGFWLYLFFAQCAGMHANSAFPSWVIGTSQLTTVLLILPALACGINWFTTIRGKAGRRAGDTAYSFAWWGAAFFVLTIGIAAIASLRPANRMFEFTVFQTGVNQLFLLGFFTSSIFAALHYILPRVTELEWPRPALNSLHLRLTLSGTALMVISLLVAGLIQGGRGGDASADYLTVVRSVIGPMGGVILGFALLIAGQFAFLLNISSLFCASCCCNREGARP